MGLFLVQIHLLVGVESPDERLLVFDRSEAQRFVFAPAAIVDDVVFVAFGPGVPAVVAAFLSCGFAVEANQMVVAVESVAIGASVGHVTPLHAVFDEVPDAVLFQVPVI